MNSGFLTFLTARINPTPPPASFGGFSPSVLLRLAHLTFYVLLHCFFHKCLTIALTSTALPPVQLSTLTINVRSRTSSLRNGGRALWSDIEHPSFGGVPPPTSPHRRFDRHPVCVLAKLLEAIRRITCESSFLATRICPTIATLAAQTRIVSRPSSRIARPITHGSIRRRRPT